MANIQQAAKWMQEGKRVTRPNIKDYSGYKKAESIALDEHGLIRSWWRGKLWKDEVLVIDVEGLLADDWEIAPSPTERGPE